MDEKTAVIILKSMLLPYADYNSVFFSGLCNFEQNKIQILQNIAIRICLNVKDPMLVSVKKLHEKVKVLPIDLRRKYLQGILCYRLINLKALSMVNNRTTRAGYGPLIETYLTHTKRIQVSPPNNAYDMWNSLRPEVRNSDSCKIFKSKLKSVIKNQFKNDWRYDLQFTNMQ